MYRSVSPLLAALAVPAFLLAGCASTPAGSKPPSAPTPLSVPAMAAPAPAPAPAAAAAAADADAAADAQPDAHALAFAAWVAEFRQRAVAAGISARTLDLTLVNAQFLPQVIELDRSQPEFTRTVWDYLDRTVGAQRVTMGRQMLARVRAEAPGVLQRQQTVPPEVVVAIWGMESNYGSNYGSTKTIDALATLGFEGRRASWAGTELLAALKIVENGDIAPERMIGSWAGAMGQTQFLPSSFLAYATDGDGDGHRDIWNSLPDVVASTANYLARSGWQAQEPWGVEARLPAGFDYATADDSVRRSSAQWIAAGVTAIDGTPLPRMASATVLLPAGANGPAFVVGTNFRTILKYNNSTSYALAVGSLSQQIGGGAPIQAAWPRDIKPLSRTETMELQKALARAGFDSGLPDGISGPATRAAIRAFQMANGLPADGFPGPAVLARLLQP